MTIPIIFTAYNLQNSNIFILQWRMDQTQQWIEHNVENNIRFVFFQSKLRWNEI